MTALGEDLLHTVNKLQDLVFNTIGNDSLDLPQIVSGTSALRCMSDTLILTPTGCRRLPIVGQVFGA